MRIGLVFDQASQSAAASARAKFDRQKYDVVCIGCARDLVDKLAAGDCFDVLVDCCATGSLNSRAAAALAELYSLPTACVDDLLRSENFEARRPHMLEMAGNSVRT